MKNYPKVVGFVPAYNAEKFIIPTLESLRKQTYPNFEIIVCDDASPDNTFEICKEFAKDNPNFTVIRNETNLGWFATYEKLWKISADSSDYCFFSPHDDLLFPNFVSEQIEILKENPKAALCIPGMNNCFQNEKNFPTTYLDPTEKNDPLDRVAVILERKEWWWAACHGICKSSIIKQILPLKKLKFGEKEFFADLLWLLEIAFLGEFVHSKNILFSKHYNSNSVSGSWKYGVFNEAALWMAILDCINHSTLSAQEKGRIRKRILSLITGKIVRKIKSYRNK